MPATKAESSATYMRITNGRLVVSATENTPGASTRKNKDGKEVYEILFKDVTGKITNMEIKEFQGPESKFETWNITLRDEDTTWVVSVNVGSGYARDMLPKLAGIVLDEEVTIQPYRFEKEKKVGVVVKQDGVKLFNRWVKKDGDEYTHLEGFPELKKGMTGSKYQMYKLQVDEFIRDFFEKDFMPSLTVAVITEDDDVPF